MCGRYALDVTGEAIATAFGAGLGSAETWSPSWNVAPTCEAPVIRMQDEEARVDVLRWGLVPSWSSDPSGGARMINARAETVHDKPAYRRAFRERRCLVPVRAFYEWAGAKGRRRPFAIRSDRDELLVLAGLWEAARQADGTMLETFTIVTTAAGSGLDSIHHRMPVILCEADRDHWLGRSSPGPDDISTDSARSILARATDRGLRIHGVSGRVGSSRNDGPELLEEVASEPPPEGGHPGQPGLFGDPAG